MRFDRVPLHISFRTLPGVLAAVDRVFAQPDKQAAVLETDFVHDTARADAGGMVTLWPPIQEQDPVLDTDEWPLEVNKGIPVRAAPGRRADRAARSSGWIDASAGRSARAGAPVTADDVLILVQIRGALFHELIRALHPRGPADARRRPARGHEPYRHRST